MKIGIYNQYWSTLGGGEKHIGSLIDEAFDDVEVELVSTNDFDLDALRSRLSLRLRNGKKVIWPALPESCLTPWTSEYDLFINSTYRSALHSLARKSCYFVFFPQRPEPCLNRMLGGGESVTVTGCYAEEPDGLAWSFPTSQWRFYRFRRLFVIPLRPIAPEALKGTDLSVSAQHCVVQHVGLDRIVVSSVKPFISEVTISVPKYEPGDLDRRCLGLPVDLNRLREINDLSRNAVALRGARGGSFISSYQQVIANSDYTSGWIRKRWGVGALVLTPKIDRAEKIHAAKERIIISVGRFFAERNGSHNKKQSVLIEGFKRLLDRRDENYDWKLVLVGSSHDSPEDRAYLAALRHASENYPIEFYVNAGRSKVVELYQKASLFWQATGFGESPQYPERFEHFGITTCEAMSYGCVPVVYDAAGQIEIVRNRTLGYRFRTIDSLVESSRTLIGAYENGRLEDFAQRCRAEAEKYHSFNAKAIAKFRSFCALV